MSIGIFLSAMDGTIIAASFARIGSELNHLQNTSWIATGYMLMLTSFQYVVFFYCYAITLTRLTILDHSMGRLADSRSVCKIQMKLIYAAERYLWSP